MPLRSTDFAPGGIEALRPPFERDRHRRIEPVKTLQKIGASRSGRRKQRVENDGFPVQAQIAPLRFEL